MRKKIILLLLLGFSIVSQTSAQIEHPVKWAYGSKRLDAVTIMVFFKANIQETWHIYSAYQKDGGPLKTSFAFVPSTAYSLFGKIIEPKPISKFEKVFEINVSYFEREVTFQQKIRLKPGNTLTKLDGTLTYMVCNDQKCLPPEEVPFTIPLK